MRARHFIVEYDRAKTAQAYGKNIVDFLLKDPSAPQAVKNNAVNMDTVKAAEMVLQNQIEQGDPTKQKKYAQALARWYSKGQVQWEDVGSTMRDYLHKH